MAYFNPLVHLREVSPIPHQTAFLLIDVQNYNCHRGGAIFRHFSAEQLESPEFQYFWNRVEQIIPTWQKLQQACRTSGVEVMYTVIQSLTKDGRDRGLDYKISGFHVPPGSWDAKILDCIRPATDEIVLPKTSCSVFMSTNIDYLLRNMDKKFLIICGCVTDQCVESAVRDACDLGYLVTLIPDACATYSQARHDAALEAIKGYCRMRTCDQLLSELSTFKRHRLSSKGRPSTGSLVNGPPPPNLMPPMACTSTPVAAPQPAVGPPEICKAEGGPSHGGVMVSPSQPQAAPAPAAMCSSSPYTDLNTGDGGNDDGSHSQANKKERKTYFEYAKASWELEEEFRLPNGQSWVEVAMRGDPATGERGLVFCRICRQYGKSNLMSKGYRAGKRSALREHMGTKDHRDVVDAIMHGGMTMWPTNPPHSQYMPAATTSQPLEHHNHNHHHAMPEHHHLPSHEGMHPHGADTHSTSDLHLNGTQMQHVPHLAQLACSDSLAAQLACSDSLPTLQCSDSLQGLTGTVSTPLVPPLGLTTSEMLAVTNSVNIESAVAQLNAQVYQRPPC